MSWRSTTRQTPTERGEESGWAPRRVARIAPAPSSAESSAEPLERLLVQEEERVVVVRLRDVDWIEGDGNYVRLHEGETVHRHRTTLGALGGRLDRRRFARIHRSTWVNVERVREIRPLGSGRSEVVLRSGVALTLSRGYRRPFLAQLES
ncbi:MAG: LytTR family DNA-binding domain-containing protein [Thermoanaerobaculia bacterium]